MNGIKYYTYMDYKKYLKVLGLVAALVVAYGAGRHFAPRPAAIPHPTHAMVQQRLASMQRMVQCHCKTAKHKKHNNKPKTAKHKKHKEKAGKAHQDAPPAK